jgi:hypothetical protein
VGTASLVAVAVGGNQTIVSVGRAVSVARGVSVGRVVCGRQPTIRRNPDRRKTIQITFME